MMIYLNIHIILCVYQTLWEMRLVDFLSRILQMTVRQASDVVRIIISTVPVYISLHSSSIEAYKYLLVGCSSLVFIYNKGEMLTNRKCREDVDWSECSIM